MQVAEKLSTRIYFFPNHENKRQSASQSCVLFAPVVLNESVRAICAGCPERKECLDYALKEQISYGIWAGTTPAQRGFGQGFKHRFTGKTNKAEAIRSLTSLGRTPKEIAATLKVELAYVNQVIKIAAKLEGESQLLKEEKPSGESLSSSESAQ